MSRAERGHRRKIMRIFTITESNKIVAFSTQEEAPPPCRRRSTPSPARRNSQNWPRVGPPSAWWRSWNSLAGVEPVKKLKTAKTAVCPHLGAHPGPGRSRQARGGNREAESRTRRPRVAHRPPRARPRRARRPRRRTAAKNAPKGQESREERNPRAARGQQDGPGGRDAPAQERRQLSEIMDKDGLAATHRPRVHGRRDEKGGVHRRVLQARRR